MVPEALVKTMEVKVGEEETARVEVPDIIIFDPAVSSELISENNGLAEDPEDLKT